MAASTDDRSTPPSTWIVGDVHGCAHSLEALLAAARLGAQDRVVFVGDLVNRGRYSLDVWRCVERLGDRATIVLGNHEVHLLGRALGLAEARRGDTIDALLRRPIRDDLVDRLRAAPVLWCGAGVAVVHAGILPAWSWDEAVSVAGAVSSALRGPDAADLLARNLARRGPVPSNGRRDLDALAGALGVFTRVRMLDPLGVPEERFKQAPSDAPRELSPWYAHLVGARPDLVFGHWAALGVASGAGWRCVDGGCVWGRTLAALRMSDGEVVTVDADARDLVQADG